MSNGLVECFHRQLKAALKAQPNTTQWTEPLVLQGIRTAVKKDTHCTAAELVYGTTFRLPGEFVAPSTDNSLVDPTNYFSQLRKFMQQVRAPPTSPAHRTGYVSDVLSTAHMFSFDTTQSKSRCSSRTLAHIEWSSALTSSSRLTLVAGTTPSRWIV